MLVSIQKKELIKAKSSTESTKHSCNRLKKGIRSLYRLTPTGYFFYPIFPLYNKTTQLTPKIRCELSCIWK